MPRCQNYSISFTIATLANFELLSLHLVTDRYLISSSFMITNFQKCPECKKCSISIIIAVLANFEPLSQQIDVPLGIPMGLSAFTLLQTAGKMGISYIIFSYFINIHFWKCQKYQKCSISVTIAVLANFEPLSQQKDVPLGLPMGFSAFTLLQTASKMGISYLTFFYFMIIHFQKCPKCQKCSISITIAVLASLEPLSQHIDICLGLTMGISAFTLLQTASTMGISYLTFFYFIIIHLQKCPKCQKCSISINCTIAVLANFEPLSQQIDVPLGLPMGFWALTLSQTARRMRKSYLIFLYFMIIHFRKCPKCQKCSISVTIAVLANFEPLSQQIDVPLGIPMGLSAFTLLQTAGIMGISYLTFFYFMIIHFQKCPKCQKCSISVTIAVLASLEPQPCHSV